MPKEERIIFGQVTAPPQANSETLAQIVLERLGLNPRKKGSTDHMHKILLELYERQKQSTQMKDAALALMTVEEMATKAKISRQTMYEYLERWLQINIIAKVSFMDHNRRLIIGYKLRGNTLEDAFGHVQTTINKHLETTGSYISELQKLIKNEKISSSMKRK